MQLRQDLSVVAVGRIAVIVTISQNLDCREVATREFNCTATIESVWVKVLDKETIDSVGPCSSLFGKMYVNVA